MSCDRNRRQRAFLPGLATLVACGGATPGPAAPGPQLTEAGELAPPTDYRSWVFLTSGYAMSYGPAALAARAGGVESFDTVFVAPDAYRGFLDTGVWPEGTMFVLEIRTAEETGSIVTKGRFQTELLGVEAAVKDTKRFPTGWAYYAFDTDENGPIRAAARLPGDAACYGCHTANGAVENTFTQFYPTLFAVARAKGTVRDDFRGIPASSVDLYERVAAGGWPAGEQLLTETHAHWPDATVLREPSLNRTGYRLLGAGKSAEAIAVFAEVTRRFPASANAWDSLSEALEAAGQREPALAAVARGLAALDGDPALSDDARARLGAALRDRDARLKR